MTSPSRKSLEPWVLDSVQYYGYQIDGIRDLARRGSFLLADEMGLGKSLQALTVFAIDVKLGYSEKLLVVCPVTLKWNWADEIEKHTRFPYTVLGHAMDATGGIKLLSPQRRDEQILEFILQSGPRILIVNYEQVTSQLAALNAIDFDVLLLDEAQYIKGHKAKRTKAALKIKAKRSFVLTGSPMLNYPNELWPLLNRIDPGRWPRYWSFVQRHCVMGGYKGKTIVGVKNKKELIESLQGVMLRRLKKDVLDLPEVQIIPRVVGLHPEQRRLYDQVMEEMRLEIPVDPTQAVDIQNALTKFLRLKQICGTTATILGPEEDHSNKLDLATSDDIELTAAGERVVVFTQFRGVQAAYVKRMGDFVPDVPLFELNGDVPMGDRIATIKRWAATGEAGVLVCMIQVAGVGLNLTAARHGSFLDKLFVPGLNRQAIDRLHRIGQDKSQPVQIREYRVRGTVETRVERILLEKKTIFDSVVDTPSLKRSLVTALLEEAD